MLTSINRAVAIALSLVAISGIALSQPTNNPIRKSGKYAVELRIPAGGIFAEETIDVEFRLTDTSNSDPIQGAAGVVRANPIASITMPAMAGMPAQKPRIHSEGIPGDYGIECYFPHGGTYKIDLSISPPGAASPFKVSFNVDVKDAETGKLKKPRIKPYTLIWVKPVTPRAEQPIELQFAVRDSRTREMVTDFEIVHEKPFHFIAVSRDLSWFVHLHPDLQPDGLFKLNMSFPFAGEYRLFGDVAPKGAGSQVLPMTINVGGVKPGAEVPVTMTPRTIQVSGITGSLDLELEKPKVGTSTNITFRLTDTATGAKITNIEPYLGAMGHLILISKDGKTFVHSHPLEDDASLAKGRNGIVTFGARFPVEGRFKAWGQFQIGGKVVTIPFVIDTDNAPNGVDK